MAAPAWAMAETTAAVGFDSNLPRAPRGRLEACSPLERLFPEGGLVASSRSRNSRRAAILPICSSFWTVGEGHADSAAAAETRRSRASTFARARRASSRCRPASLQLHAANGSPRRAAALAASCRVTMPAKLRVVTVDRHARGGRGDGAPVGGAPERSLQRERVCGSGGSSLRGANDQLRFTGSLVGPMAACSAVACSTRRRAACVACSIQLRGRLAPRHFYLYHRGTSDDSSTRQRTAQQQGRPHQLRHVSHQQLLLSCPPRV